MKTRVKDRISLLLIYVLITRGTYTAKNDTKSESDIESVKKLYLSQYLSELLRDEFQSLLKYFRKAWDNLKRDFWVTCDEISPDKFTIPCQIYFDMTQYDALFYDFQIEVPQNRRDDIFQCHSKSTFRNLTKLQHNEDDIYIHIPCNYCKIRCKRKILIDIYIIYATTKRFKLLTKCADVIERTILQTLCFLVNFVDF